MEKDIKIVETEETLREEAAREKEKIRCLFLKIQDLKQHTDFLNNINTELYNSLNVAEHKIKYLTEENNLLKNEIYRNEGKTKNELLQSEGKIKYYEDIVEERKKYLLQVKCKEKVILKRVHGLEENLTGVYELVEMYKKEISQVKRRLKMQKKKYELILEVANLTESCFHNFLDHNAELAFFVDQLAASNQELRTENIILKRDLDELQDLSSKNDKGEDPLSLLNEINLSSSLETSNSLDEIDDIYESIDLEDGRVNTDTQKSIEVKSGSTLLQKSLLGSEENVKNFSDDEVNPQKKHSTSGKSLICHSPDVRDQINEEIRALREQLVRSQVLFTYLLKDGSADHASKSLDCKTHHLRTLLEEGNLSEVIFQCKSFDGQVPARFYNRSNRSSSSYASHRSTPMHCGYTSQSCPTLPIESPVVTKSTQTEPVSGITFYTGTGTNGILSATSSNSLSKGNVFFSPPSTPCEPVVITDVCEVHREPDDHSFPRHRTNSFLSAVKEGNPNLIDIALDISEKPEDDRNFQYDNKKSEHLCSFIEDGKTKYFGISSMSKVSDSSLKSGLDDNKSENVSTIKKRPSDDQGSSGKATSEQIKSGNDTTITDEKNENNKEKIFKSSQRSMRRGSGAEGSPNSQLSIPRCPAFDYGEQEDAQSLFPSPSEPEANRNIKAEILQVMKNSELVSDGDGSQNGSKCLKESSQKKRESTKSKTLMPELMENSETESAKGSFECEAPDLPPSVDAPPVPVTDIAFPSLPNTFLAKLGVHKDCPISVESFDEQELESKFIALSLAFKTDRTTLSKRLELHKRQRDMAEKNVEKEFKSMREHLNALNLKATRADVRELISKIQNHLDIAQQAAARVSGRSETYGAVQQEERVSRAFEVLVLHVDHLKRLFDKEHKELEETRRILTDTQAFRKDIGENVTEDQKKFLRSFGLPVASIKSVGRRRASVADFHQHSSQEIQRTPSFNQSWTSGFGARKVEPRHRTLCPFPTASSVGLSSSSLPTSQVSSISPTRISTVNISARRSSLPAASPLVPNMLQNTDAASTGSNITTHSLPFPDKLKKTERNFWTRKLSCVNDETEQDDDETDYVKQDKDLNENSSETMKKITFEEFSEQTSPVEEHSSRNYVSNIIWDNTFTKIMLCILLFVLVFYFGVMLLVSK